MSKVIDIKVATIEQIQEDVIKTSYKTGMHIELEHAIQIDEIYLEISNDLNVFSIVHAVGIHSNISNEAQEFFSKTSVMAPRIKAAAIILSNLPTRILARFFIQFYKPPYRTRIFNSEKEALIWFDKLREEAKEITNTVQDYERIN